MFIFHDSEEEELKEEEEDSEEDKEKDEEEFLDLEEPSDSPEEEEQQEDPLDTLYLNDKNCYESVPVDKKQKPILIFCEIDDIAFVNVSKVYLENSKEMQFFSKLRHHYPVSHFLDKPERPKHVYEKQYWAFTFFDRFVVKFRHMFGPLNSAPFSVSGDCEYFERQTLYSPQSCPIYVLRSRDLMINNMKRFSRITAILQKDEYDEESFNGDFPDDSGFEIHKFLKRRGDTRVVKDKFSKIPTVNIDRSAIPDSISSYS